MALEGLITLMLPGNRPLELDPATLAMRLRNPDVVISLPVHDPAVIVDAKHTPAQANLTWDEGASTFAVAVQDGRVKVTINSVGAMTWPKVPAAPAWLLPLGEGVRVDARASAWRSQLAGQALDLTDGLTAPFVGCEVAGGTLSYVFQETPRTELAFGADLALAVTHRFLPNDGREDIPYVITVVPGPADPLAPAKAYRAVTPGPSLAEKIRRKPAVAKLAGAIHAYMWGDGRTARAVAALKALGVTRAWLGFDGQVKDPKFMPAAVATGYLVGPYDTYCNVQDPAKADARTSVFDRELYEHGGIMEADGTRKLGFGRRGFELSSEALKQAKRDWVGERLAADRKAGANSVFVDCDADGQLFEDLDPAHPMTPWDDRRNRLARLDKVGATGLVVGSETGTAWAVPALDFAHGAASVTGDAWWKLLSSKAFGGYWPEARPKLFFQPATASAVERQLLFDPATRLPLYQAAFHDQLVSTERWELSPVKIRGLERVRAIQELLYGVPSLWNLDMQAIEDNGPRIRDLYRFFAPIHAVIATEPLTRFETLTPDRLVQRTRFGDQVELTANFRPAPYQQLPPVSIMVKWLKTGRLAIFQPSPWWGG